MAYTVNQEELQYEYNWKRDKGDGKYIGLLDRIKVDKDEGYEVVYFIESLMKKHNLNSLQKQKNIENALHSDELHGEDNREKLIKGVEKALGL